MSALSIDRATLTSLRHESGLLPPVERRALHTAQALLRGIDRALELHTPDSSHVECVECGHPYPCPTVRALGAES